MNKYKTEIFWYEPDQEFVARVVGIPEFKYLSGMAETKAEALRILEEDIEEIIEDMIENNEPIPEPQYETTKQD
jgi:predicted RNase H-like HicB family nuclease